MKEQYFEFIDFTDDILLRFKKMMVYLKEAKTSNCKILVTKVINLKVKNLAPKLKDAIDQMYEYFYESFNGFYCTICDAES